MKKIISLLILGGLGYYGYQHFMSPQGAFDFDGQPKVLLFTFAQCGAPCTDAKKLLERKQIVFENVSMDSGPEAEKRLRSLGGGNPMPVLFVGSRKVNGFERDRYREALAEAYGLEMLGSATREVLQTHFDASGEPVVVMYGASWCPHCKAAREYFTQEGIPFKEWDVEQNATGQRYYAQIKSSGYPLIYVGYRRFEGLDKSGIEKAIGSHHL